MTSQHNQTGRSDQQHQAGTHGQQNAGSTGATISLLRNVGFTVGPAVASATWGGFDYSVPGLQTALGMPAAFAAAGVPLVLAAVRRHRATRAGASR